MCKIHGAKVKLCISDGCKNQAQRGGVCRGHGAKVTLCSKEGCTNQAQRGGVCRRHGAYHATNNIDESTAFGSEFEQTTVARSQSNEHAVFQKRWPFSAKKSWRSKTILSRGICAYAHQASIERA